MSDIKKIIENNYNKPLKCEKCGSRNINYKGVGEYSCGECRFIMYDDYGIVRNYLEKNPGATQSQVARDTKVSKSRISQMLRDDRIEIAEGSAVFLSCEKCGAGIRSGRYCTKCEAEMLKSVVTKHTSKISGGFGKAKTEASGAKRFNR